MNEEYIIVRLELLELKERESATREARLLQKLQDFEKYLEPYKHDPRQVMALLAKLNDRIIQFDVLKLEAEDKFENLSKKIRKLDGFSRKLTITRKEIQKLEKFLTEEE